MRFQAEFDITGDTTLQDFLEWLDKVKGRVVKYEASGPGGGHPCVTLEFHEVNDAIDALTEAHDGDYDLEWITWVDNTQ